MEPAAAAAAAAAPETSVLIVALLGAFGTAMTALSVWVGKWIVRYLRAKNIRLTAEQEQGLQNILEWGAKQAVRATEQLFVKNVPNHPRDVVNDHKLQHAIAQTRSLAPRATENLSDEQVRMIVEAQVAEMKRPSQPVLTSIVPLAGAEPPEFFTIPGPAGTVTYTRSIEPPKFPESPAPPEEEMKEPSALGSPLPPPAPIPRTTRDRDTPLEKHLRGKR